MQKYKMTSVLSFLSLILLTSSCYTFNLSNVMTSGEATDVIDSAQTHDQDPNTDLDLSTLPAI